MKWREFFYLNLVLYILIKFNIEDTLSTWKLNPLRV